MKTYWLSEFFSEEFGTSDVQANYSRAYSWLANQFGHFTLGLLTTLIFGWLVRALVAVFTGGWLLGQALLALVVLGSGLAAWRFRRGPDPVSAAEYRHRIVPIPPRYGAATGAITVAVALVLAVEMLFHPLAIAPAEIAVATVCLWFAAAVLVLSRDAFAGVIGAAALGVSFVLGAGPLESDLGALLAILAAAVVPLGLLLRPRPRDPDGGRVVRRSRSLLVLSWVWFLGFVLLLPQVAAGTALLPLAAANAALAFWWVKEFGSDLPKVCDEIRNANGRRQTAGSEPCIAVENEYFVSALWDARTDGVFYAVGAAMAVVFILARSASDAALWVAVLPLAGVVLSMATFLLLGRLWIARQNALDAMNAPFASRLAVFWHRAEFLPGCALPDPAPRPFHELERLLGFATRPTAARAHLLVFGNFNAGKTALGLAIGSECALAELHPRLCLSPGRLSALRNRRSARYVTYSKLLFELKKPGAPGDVPSASMVVLDDAELDAPEDLRLMLTEGFRESVQAVVWLVGVQDPRERALPDAASGVALFRRAVSDAGLSDVVYALQIRR